MPWPSRGTSSLRLLQPVIPPVATRASTQRIAALRRRRGLMRRRSLTPGRGRGPPRMHPEARRRQRLEAGDGRTCERTVGLLLEDHSQPLERRLGPALYPAPEAELLLEPLPRRARLAPDREGNAREAAAHRL